MSKHYRYPSHSYPKTLVEVCKVCEGYGAVSYDRLTNYHRGEYETIREECSYCKGSGRVKITVTTTYEPFVREEK